MKTSIRIFSIVGIAMYVIGLIASIAMGILNTASSGLFKNVEFSTYMLLFVYSLLIMIIPCVLHIAASVWLFIISKPKKKMIVPEIVILAYLSVVGSIFSLLISCFFNLVVIRGLSAREVAIYSSFNTGNLFGGLFSTVGLVACVMAASFSIANKKFGNIGEASKDEVTEEN